MFASNVEEGIIDVPPSQVKDLGKEKKSSDSSSSAKGDTSSSEMAIDKKKACYAFTFVLICVSIGLLASSLKKVDNIEYGLQYNIHKKELDDAAKSGGLFAGPPGYEFIKFPSTFITVDLDDRTCVSQDGLLVVFSVTFQYQMTEPNLYPAIVKYRDFDKWANTVEEAGLSAMHHSCSDFQVTEFQSKRGLIQSTMESNLRLKLEGNEETGEEGVNAVAVSLQLRYIGLPALYQAAVGDKQAAEEEISLAIAERKQEVTKATTALLTAQEEAKKILDTAVNEAEVVLTEAQLKAEETLFSFEKESQTLVNVKNSLNLTTEGVLAYLANMLLSEASTLQVMTGEPAKLSRKENL